MNRCKLILINKINVSNYLLTELTVNANDFIIISIYLLNENNIIMNLKYIYKKMINTILFQFPVFMKHSLRKRIKRWGEEEKAMYSLQIILSSIPSISSKVLISC